MAGLHEDVVGSARKAVVAAHGGGWFCSTHRVCERREPSCWLARNRVIVSLLSDSALGAGVKRMVRQFVAEGFVLVLIATILGVAPRIRRIEGSC
jgi:hypothetical protein